MKIKLVDTETLESTLVNQTCITFEQAVDLIKKDIPGIEPDTSVENGSDPDIFRLGRYIGYILYRGVDPADYKRRGRAGRDWTEERKKFNEHYKPTMTAKQLSLLTGIDRGRIYYISKMENKPLKAGKRGRRN